MLTDYQPLIDPQVETRNGTDQSVTETARDLIQRAKDIVETQKDEFQTLIKVCYIKHLVSMPLISA